MEKKDLCKVFSTANPQGTTRSGFFFIPSVSVWQSNCDLTPCSHSFVSRVRAAAHVVAGSGEQGERRRGAHDALLQGLQRSGGGEGSGAVRPLGGQLGPDAEPVET